MMGSSLALVWAASAISGCMDPTPPLFLSVSRVSTLVTPVVSVSLGPSHPTLAKQTSSASSNEYEHRGENLGPGAKRSFVTSTMDDCFSQPCCFFSI